MSASPGRRQTRGRGTSSNGQKDVNRYPPGTYLLVVPNYDEGETDDKFPPWPAMVVDLSDMANLKKQNRDYFRKTQDDEGVDALPVQYVNDGGRVGWVQPEDTVVPLTAESVEQRKLLSYHANGAFERMVLNRRDRAIKESLFAMGIGTEVPSPSASQDGGVVAGKFRRRNRSSSSDSVSARTPRPLRSRGRASSLPPESPKGRVRERPVHLVSNSSEGEDDDPVLLYQQRQEQPRRSGLSSPTSEIIEQPIAANAARRGARTKSLTVQTAKGTVASLKAGDYAARLRRKTLEPVSTAPKVRDGRMSPPTTRDGPRTRWQTNLDIPLLTADSAHAADIEAPLEAPESFRRPHTRTRAPREPNVSDSPSSASSQSIDRVATLAKVETPEPRSESFSGSSLKFASDEEDDLGSDVSGVAGGSSPHRSSLASPERHASARLAKRRGNELDGQSSSEPKRRRTRKPPLESDEAPTQKLTKARGTRSTPKDPVLASAEDAEGASSEEDDADELEKPPLLKAPRPLRPDLASMVAQDVDENSEVALKCKGHPINGGKLWQNPAELRKFSNKMVVLRCPDDPSHLWSAVIKSFALRKNPPSCPLCWEKTDAASAEDDIHSEPEDAAGDQLHLPGHGLQAGSDDRQSVANGSDGDEQSPEPARKWFKQSLAETHPDIAAMVVRDLQPDDPLAAKCREENNGQLFQDPTLISKGSSRYVVFECPEEPAHRFAEAVHVFLRVGCRECKAAVVKETLADTHPDIAAMVVRDLQPDDPLAVQCREENKGRLFQDPALLSKGSSRRVVFECRGEPSHRFVDMVQIFLRNGCRDCKAAAGKSLADTHPDIAAMVVRDLQPDDPLAVQCREENKGRLFQDPALLSKGSSRRVVFECRGEPSHRFVDMVQIFLRNGCRDCKAAAGKSLADTHPDIAAMVVRDLQPDDPLAVQCREENKGRLFQDPALLSKGSSRRVVFECRGEQSHRQVETVGVFVRNGCRECKGPPVKETLADAYPDIAAMVVRDLQPDDPLAVKCREENSGQLLQDPTLLSPVSRRHVVFECRGEPTHRVADTVNYFVHYGCRDCKAAAVKETLADTHPHIAAMVVRDLQPDDPLAVQCRVENKGQLFQDPTRITKGSSRRVVFECRGEPTHRFVDTVNLFVNRGCKLCNALARERGAMAKARKSEVLPIESGAASKEGSRRKSEPVGRSKRKLDDLELEESGAESAAAKRPLKESTGSSRLLHGQHQTQDDRVILGSQDRLDGVRASAPSAASLDDEVTPIMDSVDGSTDSDREDGLSGILRRLNQLERENDQLRKDVARLTQEHEALEAKQTASWNDLNTWKGMISRELHKARDGNQGDRERAVGFFNEVGRFLNEGRDYLRQYEEEEREDSFESMVERERLKTAPVSSALAKLLGQPRPSGSA